jgi:hypothetical protein
MGNLLLWACAVMFECFEALTSWKGLEGSVPEAGRVRSDEWKVVRSIARWGRPLSMNAIRCEGRLSDGLEAGFLHPEK